MKVRLISVTKPVAEDIKHYTSEELTAYVARVSNPSNQLNSETSSKLLGYCIRNNHWSVFEHVMFTVEIKTSRAIAAQILRHRSAVFQEFCVSGDTEIYFDLPHAVKSGRRALYKQKIEDLYKKFTLNDFSRRRICDMSVRYYDEKTKLLSHSKVKDVFKTGLKDIFEITLANGKKIKTTKEHKFLVKDAGFISLEDAVGLSISGKTATMTRTVFFATNGVAAYQDQSWLKKAKEKSIIDGSGLSGIAEQAGVTSHTIRKWLKINDCSFTKKEVASYSGIWNKGKFGYKIKPRSKEQREHVARITPKGKNHHAYRGGSASHRKAIANHFNKYRNDIYKSYGYTCQLCLEPFSSVMGRIELHHLKEVAAYPHLALDLSNVVPVHRSCHMSYHGKSEKFKELISKNRRTTKLIVPKWSEVRSVRYVGKEETYDMEVKGSSHNYVANGIITHNSQRYATAMENEFYPARRQDNKNRQNSIDDMSDEDKFWFESAQFENWSRVKDLYDEALRRGIAKEQARFLLPLSTQTTIYMTNNVRNWIHYIDLRTKNGTQLEHKEIAEEIKNIFIEQFPDISKAKEWIQ